MNIFETHQCTLFLSLCFTNCSYEADHLFMFDKIHKICPPLNTWNGWSSFQEVCFQRQWEEKGWEAAWWAKCSEFCCHLDPGDPFTPLPSAAITRSVQPYPCLLHDMKRKPCNQTRGGQTWQRSVVEKGKSRIRRPGPVSTNREYVATKKNQNKTKHQTFISLS